MNEKKDVISKIEWFFQIIGDVTHPKEKKTDKLMSLLWLLEQHIHNVIGVCPRSNSQSEFPPPYLKSLYYYYTGIFILWRQVTSVVTSLTHSYARKTVASWLTELCFFSTSLLYARKERFVLASRSSSRVSRIVIEKQKTTNHKTWSNGESLTYRQLLRSRSTYSVRSTN